MAVGTESHVHVHASIRWDGEVQKCNDMRKLNWKSTKWFINKEHQAQKKKKKRNQKKTK